MRRVTMVMVRTEDTEEGEEPPPENLSFRAIFICLFLSIPHVMDISRVMISNYTLSIKHTVLSNQFLGSEKKKPRSRLPLGQ